MKTHMYMNSCSPPHNPHPQQAQWNQQMRTIVCKKQSFLWKCTIIEKFHHLFIFQKDLTNERDERWIKMVIVWYTYISIINLGRQKRKKGATGFMHHFKMSSGFLACPLQNCKEPTWKQLSSTTLSLLSKRWVTRRARGNLCLPGERVFLTWKLSLSCSPREWERIAFDFFPLLSKKLGFSYLC